MVSGRGSMSFRGSGEREALGCHENKMNQVREVAGGWRCGFGGSFVRRRIRVALISIDGTCIYMTTTITITITITIAITTIIIIIMVNGARLYICA